MNMHCQDLNKLSVDKDVDPQGAIGFVIFTNEVKKKHISKMTPKYI
jgi:hypothetical protein